VKKLAALVLLLSPRLAGAADPEVTRVLERFDRAKPDAKALAFYSLDWAPNLKEAQARAAKERRPVFLIVNTNITAGCNFFSGHT
jgi:hypothetical protein